MSSTASVFLAQMVHSWHVTFHFLGPAIVITIILAGEKDMGNDVDSECWNSQDPSKSIEFLGNLTSGQKVCFLSGKLKF